MRLLAGLAMLVAAAHAGPSAAAPLAVGTPETCAFAPVFTFDPPLAPEPQRGNVTIGAADGRCAAGFVACEPEGPFCFGMAGSYERVVGDGAFVFEGTCGHATVTTLSGGAGHLVAGRSFAVAMEWTSPAPGVKLIEGALEPQGGNACAMASATCACVVTNAGYVPP